MTEPRKAEIAKPKKIAKTAALAIPEIGVPLAVGSAIAEKAGQVLTGDLIVIRRSYPHGSKKNPQPPTEVEYHVNPLGIGIGALALGAAALVGAVAYNGFGTLGGGLTGLKDSRPGKEGPPPQGWFPALDKAIADFKHSIGLP